MPIPVAILICSQIGVVILCAKANKLKISIKRITRDQLGIPDVSQAQSQRTDTMPRSVTTILPCDQDGRRIEIKPDDLKIPTVTISCDELQNIAARTLPR